MSSSKINPFQIEAKRSELARHLKYKELVSTYDAKYPEITDSNSPKLWDNLNLNTLDYEENHNPMAKDRIKTISQNIEGENIRILSAGFGSASLEKYYFSKKKEITKEVVWEGFDISIKSVDKASIDFPQAKLWVGDIKKIKSKNNYYDYAIASEVLEHIQPHDTFYVLSELYRVLKPGGKLLISVPLNEGLEHMIKEGLNPNAHVRIYTPALIKAELGITGFNIIKNYTFFAFNKYYSIKSFIVRNILLNFRIPNNILVIAQKPGSKK